MRKNFFGTMDYRMVFTHYTRNGTASKLSLKCVNSRERK